jgi:predicted O-linked N-acetylglucosamine transferase (SPINDLY family)
MTISEAFELALQRHRAGRLEEAGTLYRQILAAQPNHADALHLLGVIAHQGGRHELAVEWIRKAIEANSGRLHYYLNLGNALAACADPAGAIAAYRRALALNPAYPEAHNNLGVALAAQGQLDAAIAAYRRALDIKPDYPEAHNNLGNALRDRGLPAEAAAACRRAIELSPGYAEAHNNLGAALAGQRQFEAAAAAYRRAIELKPDYPEAHNNLGAALAGQRQFHEAITAHRRALEWKADYPEAHNNLGIALAGLAQLDEAISAHRRALELKPDFPEAWNNLGNALRLQGRRDEAIPAYRRALQGNPRLPEVWKNLGITLEERWRFDEAAAAFQSALELDPGCAEVHRNLGNALAGQGRLDDAMAAYLRALQLQPDSPDAHNDLGRALRKQGRLYESMSAYRRALSLNPDYAEAHNNLGDALREIGQIDEALACFRRALEILPSFSAAHTNLILNLHYAPDSTDAIIAEECARWWARHGAPLLAKSPRHSHDRSPSRRLRIGYVSADFREHPVARHLLPVMREHDAAQFDLVCYSGVTQADAMTERFMALGAQWREAATLDDDELAERIREDAIDILVDLSLHTRGNRLLVFARQPAPVQVSFAGYPGATGLETIAYRFTDRFLEPEGQSAPHPFEQPVRLPDSFWCYDPCGDEAAVNPPPALERGYVTFGSLNNFCKVNDRTLRLWARAVGRVKDSRLVMRCPEGDHRRRTLDVLAREGVEGGRVEFVEARPRREYLELYHGLDIVLDTFPYNGHITACDALWMGVPVVSLTGTTPVSRGALSLLSNVELEGLAPCSEEDCVRAAVELAGDLPRLAALRSGLRERMRASPLIDASRFARNMEAAYRQMWERWRALPQCAS